MGGNVSEISGRGGNVIEGPGIWFEKQKRDSASRAVDRIIRDRQSMPEDFWEIRGDEEPFFRPLKRLVRRFTD